MKINTRTNHNRSSTSLWVILIKLWTSLKTLRVLTLWLKPRFIILSHRILDFNNEYYLSHIMLGNLRSATKKSRECKHWKPTRTKMEIVQITFRWNRTAPLWVNKIRFKAKTPLNWLRVRKKQLIKSTKNEKNIYLKFKKNSNIGKMYIFVIYSI